MTDQELLLSQKEGIVWERPVSEVALRHSLDGGGVAFSGGEFCAALGWSPDLGLPISVPVGPSVVPQDAGKMTNGTASLSRPAPSCGRDF